MNNERRNKILLVIGVILGLAGWLYCWWPVAVILFVLLGLTIYAMWCQEHLFKE